MELIPSSVLESYSLAKESVERIPSLINETYSALTVDGQHVIVQRLHAVFRAEVNTDIHAVTQHLVQRGLLTPTLIETGNGALWVSTERGVWRAQTFMAGSTLHRLETPSQAQAAARFVARFHAALADLPHRFASVRQGVHDTPAHLTALAQALAAPAAKEDAAAQAVGASVLRHAGTLRTTFEGPLRICHGDLKVSNLLFSSLAPASVQCLIDLDTVGHQLMAYELGDALRSWCNTGAEDAATARVDVQLFQAAVSGYASGARGFLTDEERLSIVDGLITVSCELASRFARDAIEDRYFGWDPERFSSRREHNLARARGQLQLSLSATHQRAELEEILERAFAQNSA